VPGRYAKHEMSDGFLDSVDSYVYRHPVQPVPATTPGGPGTPAPPADQAPATQPPSAPVGH